MFYQGHRWTPGSYPSSGAGAAPAPVQVAGVDGTGAWIESTSSETYAGVDGTGAWIESTSVSTFAGVDGTGAWINA